MAAWRSTATGAAAATRPSAIAHLSPRLTVTTTLRWVIWRAKNLTTGNNNICIRQPRRGRRQWRHPYRTAGTHTQTFLAGTTSVNVLQISGRADVADLSTSRLKATPKGAVVVIDDEHPGLLKMSDRSYDKRVAGIVSGGNGV